MIRPSTVDVLTTNQRITIMPTVLMNALKEYTFFGSPLWRMSDGKDLVRVELTFHKVLPTNRYKKRAESRRQPSPARRPTTTSTSARRSTPCMEQEATPLTPQTLPDIARANITYDRIQKTAIIEPEGTGHKLRRLLPSESVAMGEDTHSAQGWGHPTIGWGHPLGSWVRTPFLHPFWRLTDRHVASECTLLSTRAVCLTHSAVGIDTH